MTAVTAALSRSAGDGVVEITDVRLGVHALDGVAQTPEILRPVVGVHHDQGVGVEAPVSRRVVGPRRVRERQVLGGEFNTLIVVLRFSPDSLLRPGCQERLPAVQPYLHTAPAVRIQLRKRGQAQVDPTRTGGLILDHVAILWLIEIAAQIQGGICQLKRTAATGPVAETKAGQGQRGQGKPEHDGRDDCRNGR